MFTTNPQEIELTLEEAEKQTGFGDRHDMVLFYALKAIVLALLYIADRIDNHG